MAEQTMGATTGGTEGMSMTRRSVVQILEREENWLLRFGQDHEETHPTAADALAAVTERDRIMADAGFTVITTVHWETRTRVGTMVVRALAE